MKNDMLRIFSRIRSIPFCNVSELRGKFVCKRYYNMKGKKYIYAHKFEGLPKVTDLELVEEEIPSIKIGG